MDYHEVVGYVSISCIIMSHIAPLIDTKERELMSTNVVDLSRIMPLEDA